MLIMFIICLSSSPRIDMILPCCPSKSSHATCSVFISETHTASDIAFLLKMMCKKIEKIRNAFMNPTGIHLKKMLESVAVIKLCIPSTVKHEAIKLIRSNTPGAIRSLPAIQRSKWLVEWLSDWVVQPIPSYKGSLTKTTKLKIYIVDIVDHPPTFTINSQKSLKKLSWNKRNCRGKKKHQSSMLQTECAPIQLHLKKCPVSQWHEDVILQINRCLPPALGIATPGFPKLEPDSYTPCSTIPNKNHHFVFSHWQLRQLWQPCFR